MRFRRALAVIALSTAVPGVAAAQNAASGPRQVDIAYEITFAGLSGFSRRKQVPPVQPTRPASPLQPASAAVLGVGAATLAAQRCRRWWWKR